MAVPVPTLVPRWAQLLAWAQNTYYAVGERVIANGNMYVNVTAGTSAGAGVGPAGGGAGIADGTAVWDFVSASSTAWVALTLYALGDRVTNGGSLFVCIAAGTSAGAGGPAPPAAGVPNDITDGTVHWMYLSASTALVTQPAEGQKDVGWIVGQKPPAQYFNWWMFNVYLWLRWLADIANQAITWTATHIFQRGIVVTHSQAGQTAIQGTGNGGGAGGAFVGGGTNGKGLTALGIGTGAGVSSQGGGTNGSGGEFTGGSGGVGVKATGGSGGGGGTGIEATGTGSGHGVKAVVAQNGGSAAYLQAALVNDHPIEQARDAGNNLRSTIDHNGYRLGQVSEYYQDWRAPENLVAAGRAAGALEYNFALVGAGSVGRVPPSAATAAYALMSVANNAGAGGDHSNFVSEELVYLDANRVCVLEVPATLHLAAGNSVLYFGLTNDVGGDPDAGSDGAYFSYNPGAAAKWKWNIRATAHAPSLANVIGSTTSPVVGATPLDMHFFRVEFHGANTPLGPATRIFYDGTLYGTVAYVPAGAALRFFLATKCNAAGIGIQEVAVGPVRLPFNLLLSPTDL